MTTKFNMVRDINGYNGFGLMFSDTKYGVQLSANAEQHVTIPASSDTYYPNYLVVFSCEAGSNVWVALNETAALPTGTLGAVNCELNPTARYIKGDGNQTLSFKTADTTAYIGFTLYAVP